ncbi:MAG TPA: RHS repeat-associated core domain-containing protein [Anaerolineae bacterium]|nr:RHS repeat-associated core domain-containing protein [Anaerolineae bacterium]
MQSRWNPLRVVVSLVTVVSMLLGMVPWTVRPVRAAEVIPVSANPPSFYLPVRWRMFAPTDVAGETHRIASTTLSETLQLSMTVYLPLVMRSYTPPLPDELIIYPGVGGQIGAADRSVQVLFTTIAVTEPTRVRYAETIVMQPPTNLAIAGRAFSITAETLSSGRPITHFPFQVTVFTDTNPWWSIYTPTVIITKSYTAEEVWGLDLSVLSLYRRTGPGRNDWIKVPSAVYLDEKWMYAEVETIGEFAVMSRLAIYATGTSARANALAAQSPMTDSGTFKKLVIDPDRNEGWAVWPGVGKVQEGPYAVRLSKAVRERLQNDRCRADILLTREDEDAYGELPSVRAQMYQQFGGDTLVTFAFNALKGSPWGGEKDGGSIIWSGGDGDDDALRDSLGAWIKYLERPIQYDMPHQVLPYQAFVALPGAYAHIETLYLDHNYDWPIINTGFDSIADMAYAAVRQYLESRGMYCGDDPNNPPPYPAPPSAEMLRRWRDLGYQNYQRYGADPVSFSTGNHVVQVRLARIPARGGLDWDLTLTYNSQDTRSDLLGHGWSFPYNAYAQIYEDRSVTVALWDGRTYHYTPDGDGYTAPAGVFDRLEKTDTGWQWITPNEVTLTFSETVGGFGILTEWRDRNGNALHFTYDLSGQNAWREGNEVPRPPLTGIRNDAGRAIDVQSDGEGRITRLGLWDGRAYTFEYDGKGNLIRINDPDGQLRRFEYDERHRMTKEWDAEDILFLQNMYDDRDRVIEQVDASGTHSYLAYDIANRATTFTDNLGHREVYQWDDLNRVTAEQDAEGNAVHNEYDANYNLTTRTDANGNITRYEYDERGNLITRYDPIPVGVTYTSDVSRWTYNDRNQVTSRTDALGRTWRYDYDAAGNLIRTIAPDNAETTATYNAWGQPVSLTDALNRTTTYEYDNDGHLIKTIYPDGTFSTSAYDAAGRETAYTDANGHTVTFTYDARDNVTRITDPKGAVSLFDYDGNNLLIRSVDRRGGERRYEYDANLKLVGERDPLGLWTRYGYDANYRRTVMTDTAGFVTRYVYDAAGRLAAVSDPTGATTHHTYDANGNLIATTDALGHTTRMVYDAVNRLKFLIDANGNRTEYCYDAEDQLIRTIGPRGEVTDYTYDAQGRLIAVKDPLGNVTRYEYDTAGQRTAVVDPLGRRTDYGYDLQGRLARLERPALEGGARPTTQYGYDAVGNTVVITSPLGFVTRYEYDENDNVVKVIDPLGGETVYTYDAEDAQIAVTDANGHAVTTTYNLAGLPVQTTDALGYTTTMEYDAAYNLVKMINALGKATTYDYDPLDRLLETTDSLGHATQYTRDALGRVTRVTDANGHATEYAYDPLGQLIRVTDALSGTTAYAYDPAGNLTVITDANGSLTRFEYNFLNQLKREINPLDKTWEYSYDAAGQLIRRRDALWQATYYDYDSNGRLTRIGYGVTPETMHPVTFTYDLEGNELQMCDGLGCTTHTYDALGHPTTTTDWLGRTITRTYDAVGNLTGLTYPNGYAITYAYNANDWLTTFTDPHGSSSAFVHNALGQVTSIQHANGTRVGLAYDPVGRLLALINRGADARVQSAYRYAMDAVGNRVQVVEERAPFDGLGANVVLTRTYAYDALDRLTHAATADPASDTFYAFDAVGNRLSKTGVVLAPDPGVPALPVAPRPEAVSYTYNAANQLIAISDQQSAVSLDYNANGDRIRETEVLTNGTTLLTNYRYDREDRLVGVTKTVSDSASLTVTMVATYTYDGYGRRALKTVSYPDSITPTQVITYLYDGLDIIGAQLEVSGTVTETYYYPAPSPVTALRRPLEMERLPNPDTGYPGDRHWYQSDGLDSVVALTDENGDLASPFLYDEYGQILAGTTELQVFAYTAQDYDVETGLVHFYARYYDARYGIWGKPDTYRGEAKFPNTLHRFLYNEANPINIIDFYGFEKYIILYGNYNEKGYKKRTESFRTAAYTQQQIALSQGYNSDDILVREVSTDADVLNAIRQSDRNEIEHLYILTHGWGDNGGGLQLNTGPNRWDDTSQFTGEDLVSDLADRFAANADFHIQACQVANSDFPQEIANLFNINVIASQRSMKFWRLQKQEKRGWLIKWTVWKDVKPGEDVGDAPTRWKPFKSGKYTENQHVEMRPYIDRFLGDTVDESAYVTFTPNTQTSSNHRNMSRSIVGRAASQTACQLNSCLQNSVHSQSPERRK